MYIHPPRADGTAVYIARLCRNKHSAFFGQRAHFNIFVNRAGLLKAGNCVIIANINQLNSCVADSRYTVARYINCGYTRLNLTAQHAFNIRTVIGQSYIAIHTLLGLCLTDNTARGQALLFNVKIHHFYLTFKSISKYLCVTAYDYSQIIICRQLSLPLASEVVLRQ